MTTPPSAQADTRVRQLLALHGAAIAITSELDLDTLLQRIVDVTRDLVGCRYAALGVLGPDGYIARFPTSGVSTEERERIGAPPRGHGLLGVMLRAGETLRIPEIGADPRSVGFPPNHPPMKSLLGVPIFVRGRLMGDLYLTEKTGAAEFSTEDEWLVQLLATHAATALTNAELHEENLRALRRVEEERSRSAALLRVNQAISSSVQLEEVIDLILNSGIRLLDACAGALYLVSGAGETGGPRVSAQYGVGLDEAWGRRVSHLALDRTVAGRVILTGVAQIVPDVQHAEYTAFPASKTTARCGRWRPCPSGAAPSSWACSPRTLIARTPSGPRVSSCWRRSRRRPRRRCSTRGSTRRPSGGAKRPKPSSSGCAKWSK